MSVIIEEYLALLGFKLDDASWNKFNSGIQKAEARAVGLGTSMIAASISVAGAVSQIAKEYQNLSFAAQRAGDASIGQLKGFDYANQRIGVSIAASSAAYEGFAARVRNNPGIAQLVRNMGADPNNPTSAIPDIVSRLKQQFGPQGYFAASAMAQQVFGLDEVTFKQTWDNIEKLKEQQREYARRLAESGVNTDELGRKSREFTNAADNVLTSLNLILLQTSDKFLPLMTGTLGIIDGIAQGFVRAGNETNGFTSTVVSLVAALGGLKAAALVLRLIPGMGGIAAGVGGIAGAGMAVLPHVAAMAGVYALGDAASRTPEGKAFKATGNAVQDTRGWLNAVKPTLQRWLGIDEGGAPKGGPQEAAIDYFVKQGWTRAQAVGLVANFQKESRLDPRAEGDGRQAYGIGQWHPDRQANFKKQFGKDIRQSTFEEQLQFANWELGNTEKSAGDQIRRRTSAGGAAAAASYFYERPANGDAEADARARMAERMFSTGNPVGSAAPGGGATISVKNEFHVQTSDPKAAADRVLDGQERTNGDLVRNLKGAVR